MLEFVQCLLRVMQGRRLYLPLLRRHLFQLLEIPVGRPSGFQCLCLRLGRLLGPLLLRAFFKCGGGGRGAFTFRAVCCIS